MGHGAHVDFWSRCTHFLLLLNGIEGAVGRWLGNLPGLSNLQEVDALQLCSAVSILLYCD